MSELEDIVQNYYYDREEARELIKWYLEVIYPELIKEEIRIVFNDD